MIRPQRIRYQKPWKLWLSSSFVVAAACQSSFAQRPDDSDASSAQAAKLSDTWSKTIPIAGPMPDAPLGKWRIWVEDGWLLAERRTNDDQLEWKVVLAKTSGDEPPEIEANRTPDTLRLSYRDGRYFIRDGMGSLRVLREAKTAQDAWPELQPPAPDADGIGAVVGGGISGQVSNSWITIAIGPNRGRGNQEPRDCLVRLAHQDLKAGMIFTGRPGAAKLTCGDWFVIDDGTLLVAERVEAWQLQGELMRRRAAQGQGGPFGAPPPRQAAVASRLEKSKLAGSPAPELSGEAWLNSDQPLTWKGLRGKLVLLVLFDLRQTSFKPLIPPLLAYEKSYGKQGLAVIGVHEKCPRDEVEKHLADEAIKFPVLIDDGKTGRRFGLGASACFLVDRQGKVISGYKGLLVPPAEIEKQLRGKGDDSK